MGVHLRVAGAAGAMIERGRHHPRHLLLAHPVAASPDERSVRLEQAHGRLHPLMVGGPDPILGWPVRRRGPQHRHRLRRREGQVIAGHAVALPRPDDLLFGLLPPLPGRFYVRGQALRFPLGPLPRRPQRRRPRGQVLRHPPLMLVPGPGQPLLHRGVHPKPGPQALPRHRIAFGPEEPGHLLLAHQPVGHSEVFSLRPQPPPLRLAGLRPAAHVVVLDPAGHLLGQVLVAVPSRDGPDAQHRAPDPTRRAPPPPLSNASTRAVAAATTGESAGSSHTCRDGSAVTLGQPAPPISS